MSAREIAHTMIDEMTDEQLNAFLLLFKNLNNNYDELPKVQDWGNIEEVEPDDWDKEMIKDSGGKIYK